MLIETRPSSAHIWTKCSLAPRLIAAAPPEEPSDPAREGTCAAWVAEMVLTGQYATTHDLVGTAHENGWVVDAPMAHAVEGYVNMVLDRGGHIHTERKVWFNDLVAGTPDAFATVDQSGALYVDDLKYGYDIVDPTTPQLVIYAWSIVVEMGLGHFDRVQLGIYQPRAYHPRGVYRTRTLTVAELQQEAAEIHAASYAAHGDNPVAAPGRHCRYCRGAAQCAAVAHEVYDAVHRMQADEQRDMTGPELARELDFLEFAERVLKGRKSAVHAESEARIKRGQHIPGWMRESGYGNRRWKVDAETVRAMTGIDPVDNTKMVTPRELERRKADPEIIAALTETPRTKATLKRIPDGFYAAAFGEDT